MSSDTAVHQQHILQPTVLTCLIKCNSKCQATAQLPNHSVRQGRPATLGQQSPPKTGVFVQCIPHERTKDPTALGPSNEIARNATNVMPSTRVARQESFLPHSRKCISRRAAACTPCSLIAAAGTAALIAECTATAARGRCARCSAPPPAQGRASTSFAGTGPDERHLDMQHELPRSCHRMIPPGMCTPCNVVQRMLRRHDSMRATPSRCKPDSPAAPCMKLRCCAAAGAAHRCSAGCPVPTVANPRRAPPPDWIPLLAAAGWHWEPDPAQSANTGVEWLG